MVFPLRSRGVPRLDLSVPGPNGSRWRRGVRKEDNIQVTFTPPVPKPERPCAKRVRDQESGTCPPPSLPNKNDSSAPQGARKGEEDSQVSIILVKERVWSPLGARPQRRFGHTRQTRNGTRLGGARGPEEMQHHTKRCPAKATRPNTAGVATSAKASPGTGTWKGAPHLRSEPACPLRRSSSEGCSRTR